MHLNCIDKETRILFTVDNAYEIERNPMKHRSPIAVFFLSLFTFGIYAIVWHVKTKGELNRLGAHIPTAWLIIVPFANLYWLWKYSEGVEQVTGGKISAVMALIMLLLLSIVGLAILQSMYNGLEGIPAAAGPAQSAPLASDVQTPAAYPSSVVPTQSYAPPAPPPPSQIPQPPVPPQPPATPPLV